MRPNIVIFNPDQMRADTLNHLGNPASVTPNLDHFAKEDAVSFRNAFCQNPVCVPSRCSFFTGLYPHTKGHRTMSYMLHEDETSIFKELKDQGYYVWMNSRNDFLPAQIDGVFDIHTNETFYGGDVKDAPGTVNLNPRGVMGEKDFYSFYFGELKIDENCENYTIDDESVDKAIEKIKNRQKDKPFCLFLGLQLPHPPYQIEQPYFNKIDKEKLMPRIKLEDGLSEKPFILQKIADYQNLEKLSEEDWNEIRSCYLGMCMKVDELFGKVCSSLKEELIYDETAVFFFSDHGDYTGDYGLAEKTQNTFEDCLVNVPLIVKPPKNIPIKPGISNSLVELVDFYATAMELCNVKPTHSHFGRSLLPILENPEYKIRDYVFTEGGRLKGEIHCDESNGIKPNPYDPYYPRKMAQLDDIAHTKATMIRSKTHKYVKRLYERDEFYDLVNDPKETKNCIDEKKYNEIIQDMKEKLLEWYQETADIVPFEEDSRFSFDMVWSRLKSNCPSDYVDEVQKRIRNGENMFQLMEYVRKLNK